MEPDRDPDLTTRLPTASRPGMTRVLARNMPALEERQHQEEAEARWSGHIAEAITIATESEAAVEEVTRPIAPEAVLDVGYRGAG